MCHSKLHPFLKALPKCEHHVHLEGCLNPRLLFQLAAKNRLQLPDPADRPEYTSPETLESRYENFESLQDFLDCYYIAMSVLKEAEDFEQLAWEYFTHAHTDGVRHAEVFFDPQSHTDRGISFSTVVKGYNAALERARQDFGMSTQLIMCFLRHLPVQSANETMCEALNQGIFEDGTAVGIGLDSSEVGFPPELFVEPFGKAKRLGIRRTAHAGEEGDASYIRRALDSIAAERIDHGLRLAEDPVLLARVASTGVLLTLCPLSNVYLRCVDSIADLPVRKFLEAGVQFSINSDDPAYFGGYVLNNYCAVQEAFNLGVEEWVSIAKSSVQGSWIDDERKRQLLGMINACAKEFK